MDKKLRIGFVGTHIRMELVRGILPLHFPDIHAVIRENEQYLYDEGLAQEVVRLKKQVDGIIFGGELQFQHYEPLVEPEIPCACVQKDSTSLLNSFLTLSCQGVDIRRVSVDNYSPATVQKVLSDAGVTDHNVRVLRRQSPSAGEQYYEALFEGHRKLYRAGETEGCVTTMVFIHDRLAAEGIPVAYSRPTTDNIIRTVDRMKRECLRRLRVPEGDSVVLCARLSPPEDLLYRAHPFYVRAREGWLAESELYAFAEQTGGAVFRQSEREFVILVSRQKLLEYSRDLESLPFLQQIRDNSRFEVSLGIGFGRTPGEAQANGEAALNSASLHRGSSTFLAWHTGSVTGPVDFVRVHPERREENLDVLQPLVEKSGISAEKLYRIYMLLERTGKSLFTSAELAEQLNVSVRAANRLLIAMEESGMARLSGRAVTGKSGRPGNVYQITLDLE